MTRRHVFGFWTVERRRDLLELKVKKWTHEECARYFGCKQTSVENILHRIRKEKGQIIRPYNKPASPRRPRTVATSSIASAVIQAKIIRESLPLPKTLTAWFCGDPLPGRSALDRKRLGMADEAIIESQPGVRTNRITLPMEPMRCDI